MEPCLHAEPVERRRHLRRRHHADSDTYSHTNADTDAESNSDPNAYPDTDANRRHVRIGLGGRHGLQRGRHRQLCGDELPRQLLDAGRQPVDQQWRRRHGQAMDQPGNLQHHADSYANANTNADTDTNANADTDTNANANTDTNANPNADTYSNANPNGPRSRFLFRAVGRVWPRL